MVTETGFLIVVVVAGLGAAVGIAAAVASVFSPVPTELIAETVKTYRVPAVSPLTVH